VVDTIEEISPRGTRVCRGCGASGLVSVLDLGNQPLSNQLGLAADDVLDAFPLHLRSCPTCGLGQVGEYVLPERIFGDEYPYLSSTSTSWVEHARQYATRLVDELGLGEDDLVIEVASNDGYLLKQFQALGIRVLGIEPAKNVAKLAQDAGVPTIAEFFGAETAARVAAEHGHPRLIVANNVMAHVPDLQDFVAGFAALAADDTVITVENPSYTTMLAETQFDTIYHEHYSYLTAHAVQQVVRRHGLDLFHLDQLPTHGGSNRYWISRTRPSDDTVESVLTEELALGLFEPKQWEDFATRSRAAIDGLRTWLTDRRESGRTVAGYGAAAKGNTFLNAVGDEARILLYVVDGSVEKQGKFLPGSQVPILAPDALAADPVDDVLILPWNLSAELTALVAELSPTSSSWVAIPEVRQIS
jgi:hypothetical protein